MRARVRLPRELVATVVRKDHGHDSSSVLSSIVVRAGERAPASTGTPSCWGWRRSSTRQSTARLRSPVCSAAANSCSRPRHCGQLTSSPSVRVTRDHPVKAPDLQRSARPPGHLPLPTAGLAHGAPRNRHGLPRRAGRHDGRCLGLTGTHRAPAARSPGDAPPGRSAIRTPHSMRLVGDKSGVKIATVGEDQRPTWALVRPAHAHAVDRPGRRHHHE